MVGSPCDCARTRRRRRGMAFSTRYQTPERALASLPYAVWISAVTVLVEVPLILAVVVIIMYGMFTARIAVSAAVGPASLLVPALAAAPWRR